MLRCALDVRRGSIRLVLVACTPSPVVLEGQSFPRAAKPGDVLSCLSAWQEYYHGPADRVVCCQNDALSDGLVEALEAPGRPIEWLRNADVDAVMAAWKQLRPDPRWDRAGLMASLAAAPLGASPSAAAMDSMSRAQQWLHTWLMQQLVDLKPWLAAEVRSDSSGAELLGEIPF